MSIDLDSGSRDHSRFLDVLTATGKYILCIHDFNVRAFGTYQILVRSMYFGGESNYDRKEADEEHPARLIEPLIEQSPYGLTPHDRPC
jgi:hypothetical protein